MLVNGIIWSRTLEWGGLALFFLLLAGYFVSGLFTGRTNRDYWLRVLVLFGVLPVAAAVALGLYAWNHGIEASQSQKTLTLRFTRKYTDGGSGDNMGYELVGNDGVTYEGPTFYYKAVLDRPYHCTVTQASDRTGDIKDCS